MLENYYVDVLSPEQAKECLSIDLESLTVHTEIQSGMMLMGANWDLSEIYELLENPNNITQIGGPHCIKNGHGLCVNRPNEKPLFIAHNNNLFEMAKLQLPIVYIDENGFPTRHQTNTQEALANG